MSFIKNIANGNSSGLNKQYKYRRLVANENGRETNHLLEDLNDEDEDEDNIIMSRSRIEMDRKKSLNDNVVERPIHEGETLATLSLKYKIPVAELKRINKLYLESEFFALKSIKIPVKPHSTLHEMLENELKDNEEASSSKSVRLPIGSVSSCSDLDSDGDIHVGIISIDRILREKKTRKEAKQFLENMQKDLSELREKTKTYKDSLDEATSTLTDVRFHSLEPQKAKKDRKFIYRVLIIGFFVLIVFPIIFYVYRNHQHEIEKGRYGR